ncbi:MAG TPA: extracellular solute-binding protein [Polyangiaceae bacterium]
MRGHGFLVALLVVLAAPFLVRGLFAVTGSERRDLEPGAIELRILTPHNQDIRETFARAFSLWHQERFGKKVRVVYLTPGGAMDIVRYVNEAYSLVRDSRTGQLAPEDRIATVAELVWGGGDVTFDRELKPYLKPVALQNGVLSAAFPEPDLNGIALYERRPGGESPRWVGIALSSFGILYSPPLYRTLGLPAPKTWQDLTRPELAGLLALADPTRSGSAAIAYVMTVQRAMADAERAFLNQAPRFAGLPEEAPGYRAALAEGWKRGMRTLVLMAANARYFTDAASQPPNDVGNGEAAAGVAIDFYARVFQDNIGQGRLQYVAPRAATAVTPDPVGVLYGTLEQPELIANRFIEFLLSAEAQRLWNLTPQASPLLERSLRRLPIRRDVYRDRRGFADDEDPFRQSGDFNLRSDWMRSFRELRLVWGAAFIDGKGVLDEAYRRILAVRDAARRDRLLEELSSLPIEMSELERLSAERRRIDADPSGARDSRLYLARARVELAHRFRNHYRAVGGRAERE